MRALGLLARRRIRDAVVSLIAGISLVDALWIAHRSPDDGDRRSCFVLTNAPALRPGDVISFGLVLQDRLLVRAHALVANGRFALDPVASITYSPRRIEIQPTRLGAELLAGVCPVDTPPTRS